MILLLAGAPAGGLRAERFFKGNETGLAVRPTNQNYYISTFLGESEHYDPTFYDDYQVSLGDKPVAHFTKVAGAPADFYWYVTDPKDIAIIDKAFQEKGGELGKISPKIAASFAQYQRTVPQYSKKGIYGATLSTVKGITSIAPQKVIGDDHPSNEVDQALYQYLRSNGVSTLPQIREKPGLVNMLVNKFYMLSTTYFYRDYPHVKAFLPHLPPLKARAEKEGRPFKANVFACSTGEEVLTYAIELAEAGITDFTILASDINEPGLRHAREMKYSYAAFERLPFYTQEKVRRYFRINPKLGVWEPIDPDFFRSRIKYVTQDLLKPLSPGLDPRFAPPYDLVSIMNVLFYLEDAAVQSRKDYLAGLVGPDGILILHDFYYSLRTGTLGREWAFGNFLSINDWVNVRAGSDMTAEKKVAFYENIFNKDFSDSALQQYIWALTMTGQGTKAEKVCEGYLAKRPYSGTALNIALEFSIRANDAEKSEALLGRLQRLLPHSMETLAKLIDAEKSRKDKDFLKGLRKAQESVSANLKSRPKQLETVFDFTDPASEKYEVMRTLLKANAFGTLQNYYFSRKQNTDAERVGREGLRLLEIALRKAPDYVIAGQYLDFLTRDLLDYYVESGLDEKVMEVAGRVEKAAEAFKDDDFFYAHALRAHVDLYRAIALKRMGRGAEARAAAEASVDRFEKSLPLMNELFLSRRSFFNGDAGRAYMLRGRLRADAGEEDGARADDVRAMALLEEGLSYNPLYGKTMHGWREELTARRASGGGNRQGEAIPLAGSVLHFHDNPGPYAYTTEVVHYKAADGASIEATLVTPEESAPEKPGLVFVHMWARDRNTWWGLPEYMATHGYPSIYMDMRGHGNSRFPDSDRRVTLADGEEQKRRYVDFPSDVAPAIERMLRHPSVKDGQLVMLGASLGCPVGAIAAEKYREKFIGLVMLSPSTDYWGVNCRSAMASMSKTPLLVTAEKSDASFPLAKEFFKPHLGFKTFLQTDYLGHGTDALYRDAGLPTVIHAWLDQLQAVAPSLQKIAQTRPLLIKKK